MDFKISHGGFDDVFRHVGSAAYKAKSTAVHKSSHITSFFSSSRSNTEPTSHQMQVICPSVMTGCHKGLIAYVRKQNNKVHLDLVCVCACV